MTGTYKCALTPPMGRNSMDCHGAGVCDVVDSEHSMEEGLSMKRAMPSPEQIIWQDYELGMFIHFGIETYIDQETDIHPHPDLMQHFNPEHLDTDQWARTAIAMGAKYIVLVAKHAGGFCLWPTETTHYSVKNTPWKHGKGDIVHDLAESCHHSGLAFGVYLSPCDISLDAYYGGGGRCLDADRQQMYNHTYRAQLTELMGGYGDIFEVWFDGR